MAQTVNLADIKKGDTFDGMQYTLTNTTTGLPIDLTGATIRSIFRNRSKQGTAVSTFAIGTGITVTDATNGIFQIDAITPIIWPVSIYYYDIEITFASGDIRTYIEGTVTVIQDVTYG